MKKNITLTVEEDVLDAVRQRAAKERTTVNGLVRAYLERLARADDRSARARRRLVELMEAPRPENEPVRWDRDGAYER